MEVPIPNTVGEEVRCGLRQITLAIVDLLRAVSDGVRTQWLGNREIVVSYSCYDV